MAIHPAAVGVPAELRSWMGRRTEQRLTLRSEWLGEEHLLEPGVNRNGTERARGLRLIDLYWQALSREERWWELRGRKCQAAGEPGSSDVLVIGAGPSCWQSSPLHCSGEGGAAAPRLGKLLCAVPCSLQHTWLTNSISPSGCGGVRSGAEAWFDVLVLVS